MLTYDLALHYVDTATIPLGFVGVPGHFTRECCWEPAEMSESAYFYEAFTILWPFRDKEIRGLLATHERVAAAEIESVFDSLPWQPTDSPKIRRLADDDLSPFVEPCRRMHDLLTEHLSRLKRFGWLRRWFRFGW